MLSVQWNKDVVIDALNSLNGYELSANCNSARKNGVFDTFSCNICSNFGSLSQQLNCNFWWLLGKYGKAALFNNSSLSLGNLNQCISEVFHMIKTDRGYDAYVSLNHICCIPLATHAYFNHTYVDWVLCKGSKCQRSHRFKEANRVIKFGVNKVKIGSYIVISEDQFLRINWFTVDCNSLAVTFQMRTCESTGAKTHGKEKRINHSRCCGLTVGAANMNCWIRQLWVAQCIN